MKHNPMPSIDLLRQMFVFSEEKKGLVHTKNHKRAIKGVLAGTKNSKGYRSLKIGEKGYPSHRVAWFLFTEQDPNGMEVDHIDGNPENNLRENLRLATKSTNQCNRKMASNNTSGHKGIYWKASRKRWQVEVRLMGQSYFGGRFKNIEDAVQSAEVLRLKVHGEFARHA